MPLERGSVGQALACRSLATN